MTSAAVARWLVDHAELPSVPFTAEHLLLYESFLDRAGARYEAIARCRWVDWRQG